MTTDPFAKQLKRLVRSLGYATATFASAEEFLESGCLRETTCLITDVQMPGMSGVELQSHLMLNGQCPPMIFVPLSRRTTYESERWMPARMAF